MSVIQDIRDTFSRRDNALNQLIVLNVLVFGVVVLLFAIAFLSQQTTGWYEVFMRQLQLSANLRTLAFHPWTILTYAFVHQSPFHILFNMLNLYYFGQIIREYLGDRRLISIYVLGALAGALAFLLAYNLLPVLQPDAVRGLPVIGASAAIIAVVVAAATLLPNYTFMLFILGPVKIKWIATALVFISVAAINQKNTGGEITHIGGALLGFVFIKVLNLGRDMGRPVEAVFDWFGRVASHKPSMRVTHRQPVATSARGAAGAKNNAAPIAGQDEIDLILDKISRSGYESLSKDEKQKLFRASQQ